MITVLPSLTVLFLVVVTVINIILSIVVLLRDKRSATNIIFFILAFIVNVWAISQYISMNPMTSSLSLFWIRFAVFWAVPIPPIFFLLGNTVPKRNLVLRKRYLLLLLSSTLFVMLTVMTPYVFEDVEFKNNMASPIPGKAVGVFALFVIITTFVLIIEFVRRLRESKGELRMQLIYVFLGMILMLTLIVSTIVIPVTAFQITTFVPLFPFYSLLFTGFFTYAIFRHGLLDIRVVATELATTVIWVVLFAKIFVSASFAESAIDILILISVIIFGLFLIRSVRKEVEQRRELERLNKKLEELDARKDEFLSIAAHELRSPLTAIKGYVSMLVDGDAGKPTPKMVDFLQDITLSNDRMIRLVNNMLDMSRIEENRIVFQLDTVQVRDVLDFVAKEFAFEVKESELSFEVNVPDNIKDTVYCDRDRLHEVIANFVSNAIKYTEKGGVKAIMSNPNPDTVRLEIIDSGHGIAKDEQDKLFQKFYRAGDQGKTIGTGLGLYVSKLIIEKFNGRVGVKSNEEQGSNFWFELPLSPKK